MEGCQNNFSWNSKLDLFQFRAGIVSKPNFPSGILPIEGVIYRFSSWKYAYRRRHVHIMPIFMILVYNLYGK